MLLVAGRSYGIRLNDKTVAVKILGRHMLGGYVAQNLITRRRIRLLNSRRVVRW